MEHPSLQLIEQYNRRILSPDIFVAVQRHVECCSICRSKTASESQARADSIDLLSSLMAEPDEPYHVTHDEASAYLNHRLDEIDLEIVESHLGFCSECKEYLARLSKSAASPPVLAGTTGVRIAELARPSPGVRQAAIRRYQIAALIIVLLVGACLAVVLLRDRKGSTQTSVSPSPAPSAATEPGSDGLAEHADHAAGAPDQEPHPNPGGTSPDAPQVIVDLNDGGQRVTLDRDGKIGGVDGLPSRLKQAIMTALSRQELERPALVAQLAGRPSTLMSNSGNGLPFRLLSPVSEAIQTDRPTLRWQPLAGAASYVVTVTDDQLNEVAASQPVTALQWRLPTALRRGRVYSWQVTAQTDSGRVTSPTMPAPQAKFQVLDRRMQETLMTARQRYGGRHLSLGILYLQAGLVDGAVREFQALVKDNASSKVARNLLTSAQSIKPE